MASSINASTTAGVVTTADTSGVLNLQTAGTTAIAIDASQAVSFTNAPTVTGGTANGVAYLNGSKVLTTGSALTYASGTLSSLATTSSAFSGAADAGYSLFRGTTNSSGGVLSVSGNSTGNGINYTVFNSTLTGYEPANYGASQHIWKLGSTEALRLNSSANLVLQGGTTTANGVGITFPATQSASTDANTLDDYEEGTWTPSVGGTATYVEQLGSYTKIGNFVKIRFHLNVNNLGTGSTTTIFGIPFNASSTQPSIMGGVVTYVGGLAVAALAIGVYAQGSNIFFMTRNSSSTGITTQGPAVIGNGFDLYAEISYMV